MAKTVYVKTALTGGAAGAIDAVDGSGLLDQDIVVTTYDNQTYVHEVDDDLALSEDSPRIIVPDSNPGTINWVLKSGPNSYTKTMAGNETFSAYSDHMTCFLDAGGTARTFNPSGMFPNGYRVTITNTGGEGITFDSGGINIAIVGGDAGMFFYDSTGGTWR